MDLEPLDRSTVDDRACVVCGDPADADAMLCSRTCLLLARRELDDNVATMRRLPDSSGRRSALTRRNGRLTAALIGWDR